MFLQLSPLSVFLPLFSISDLRMRRIPNRLLLLSLLPINLSISLLFLSCIFSLLLFYLLKEDIPFALALFLAAIPLLS